MLLAFFENAVYFLLLAGLITYRAACLASRLARRLALAAARALIATNSRLSYNFNMFHKNASANF